MGRRRFFTLTPRNSLSIPTASSLPFDLRTTLPSLREVARTPLAACRARLMHHLDQTCPFFLRFSSPHATHVPDVHTIIMLQWSSLLPQRAYAPLCHYARVTPLVKTRQVIDYSTFLGGCVCWVGVIRLRDPVTVMNIHGAYQLRPI